MRFFTVPRLQRSTVHSSSGNSSSGNARVGSQIHTTENAHTVTVTSGCGKGGALFYSFSQRRICRIAYQSKNRLRSAHSHKHPILTVHCVCVFRSAPPISHIQYSNQSTLTCVHSPKRATRVYVSLS